MNSQPPSLSIIVPIYNVARYLKQCIDSILGQTYTDFELLLVDDGSTDGSSDIVKDYSVTDSRVKAIHKLNGGYGSVINVGLACSTGLYIGIVESDDYIDLRMYARLIETAMAHGCDIARCGFISFNELGESFEIHTLGKDLNSFAIDNFPEFLGTPPAIWSAIYRRELIISNNIEAIDVPRLSYQDVDFFVRTAIMAKLIVCIPECLYMYRVSSVNSSSNNRDKIDDIFFCYTQTDQFIRAIPRISRETLRHYERRKICDLQWHFRRISDQGKADFAKKASACLKRISILDVIRVLNTAQTIFLILMIRFPTLFAKYRILLGNWRYGRLTNG